MWIGYVRAGGTPAGAEAAGAQVGVEWVQEEDAQKEGDSGC